MKKQPLMQTETRVARTYRGGKLLEEFLGKTNPKDSFYPEDWISSFVEAKNKNGFPGEGISNVLIHGVEKPITDAVTKEDFGPGRTESGVLVKFLHAGERLGIQTHPTPDFSRKHFKSDYGKTECWHILKAAPGAAVYIGFKEGITKEKWSKLFREQDIDGMLNSLHCFQVQEGDTILVRAGTPHAIGAGCFLLEIQEPTDYTMRVEKETLAGEHLTPMQIHYGVGEDALLECFIYEGLSRKKAREKYFLPPRTERNIPHYTTLVTYDDTPCFALGILASGGSIQPDSFVSLVITKGEKLLIGDTSLKVRPGNKIFVPYGCGKITVDDGEIIVCHPPKI
ncbi:MAG: class I mannose-6-phosphate isomerase [Clostridia bacterium]|nr:class I mannose-6-phosphate isomerase [Clostridia bacterium]